MFRKPLMSGFAKIKHLYLPLFSLPGNRGTGWRSGHHAQDLPDTLLRLKAQLKRTEKKRDILKKAVRYFAGVNSSPKKKLPGLQSGLPQRTSRCGTGGAVF